MFTVYYTLIGIVTFFIAALVLGAWLRRHRVKENAERSSRIMHFLFFAGLVAPPLIAIVYPGLTRFDALLGLPRKFSNSPSSTRPTGFLRSPDISKPFGGCFRPRPGPW